MILDKQQIEYLAKLSKLKLSEFEKEKFARDLSDILEYVQKLDQLKTKTSTSKKIRPKAPQNLREDQVIKSDPKTLERLRSGFAESEKNLVITKKIFNKD